VSLVAVVRAADQQKEEHAMPQSPDLTKFLEAGMNFTELRRSQARQIVSELVAQGQLARDQATSTVDEMLDLSRRRREDLRSFVQNEIQRQVRALGIATREDLDRLERKIGAKASAAKKATAKKTSPSKTSPTKTTAKKAAPAARGLA
jgi:polyhydroxyalkanoate synthesis regulator phasin